MIDIDRSRRVTIHQIAISAQASEARILQRCLQALEVGVGSEHSVFDGSMALPILNLARRITSAGESKKDVESGFAFLARGGDYITASTHAAACKQMTLPNDPLESEYKNGFCC